MANKLVTAVEWLLEQIMKHDKSFLEFYGAEIEQAKQMEKKEKEYFFNCGRTYQLTGEGTFTEVYNETFKK
jgi:hypothetical protein